MTQRSMLLHFIFNKYDASNKTIGNRIVQVTDRIYEFNNVIPLCVYLYDTAFTEIRVATLYGEQNNYVIRIIKIRNDYFSYEDGKVMLYYIQK